MAITGIVKSVSGNVTATDVNGIVRTLRVGDRVSSDETISTGNAAGTTISIAFSNGTQMDLGGGSVVALNEDMLTPDASGSKEAAGQSSQQAQDDVARMQEAIAKGEDFDPSKLPATAAGGAAGGTGGGNEGHTFVQVDYLNPRMTPDSGFNTTGISVAFPVQEDVLILNPAQPVPSSPLPIVSVDVEVKVIPSAENPQSPVEERATTPGVVVDGVAIVEGTDAGNRIVNFVIQLDKVFDQDVTVNYEINGITAAGGSDFTGVLTGTVTIPAGQTNFTVPVEIVQDSNLETNETFQITLTSATNAVISSNGNSATVTIIDDDVNADNDIDSTNEAFLQANEYAFTGNVNVLSNDDLSNAVQSDGTTPLFGSLLVTTTGPVDAFVNGDPASVGTITFTSTGAYTLVLNEHGQNLVNGLSVNDSFVVSANYSIINQADSTDTATLSITINGSNGIPNINVDPGNEGADGIVYEAALANPDSNGETTAGQFTISDPDGLGDIAKVTVTNGAVTETFTVVQLAGATQQSPLTIVGQYGTLSITGYDSDTGVATYSYELTKSYTSADGSAPNTEDNKDVFTLTTTDKSDATSAPAVINIDIVDDLPTVSVSDAPITVVEGASVNGTWSHAEGADGATAKVIVGETEYSIGQSIDTGKGTLTVNSNGTWTFASANNLDQNVTQQVSFTVKVTDADGDVAQDNLTIGITDGAGPSVTEPVALTVEEAALSTGTTPGSTAEVDNTLNTLTFTAGSDAIQSIVFGSTAGISISGLDETQAVTWTLSADGRTLTGSVGGVDAIKLELGGASTVTAGGTGNVTVTATLLDNFVHQNDINVNTLSITGVTVVGSDQDGDSATAQVSVAINDDTPVLGSFDNLILANSSGSVQGNIDVLYGADGPQAHTPTAAGLKIVSWTDLDGVTETLSADGTVLTATTTGGDLFYTLTLDPLTGKYTFDYTERPTLNIPLDFAKASGGPGAEYLDVPAGTAYTVRFDGGILRNGAFTDLGSTGTGESLDDVKPTGTGFGIGGSTAQTTIENGEGFFITLRQEGSGPAFDDSVDSFTFSVSRQGGNGNGDSYKVTVNWIAYDGNGNQIGSQSQQDLYILANQALYPITIDPNGDFARLSVWFTNIDATDGNIRIDNFSLNTAIIPQDQPLQFGIAAVDGDGDITATQTLDAYLQGGEGPNYTLTGTVDDDILVGGSGNDSLVGGNGDDSLIGGIGNDTLDGGAGIDTASYIDAASGVSANLATGSATGGAGSDTLANIENLTGSHFNDTLTGNSGTNVISGGDGNDVLNGGGGNDILNGDSGNDILVFDMADMIGTSKVYDGGLGEDTLKLDGSGQSLNLTALDNNLIQNIEKIDITGTGNNSLTLNASDVLDLSSSSNTVMVIGNAGDSVVATGGWIAAGDPTTIDGQTYSTYTQGTGPDMATLLVNTDVTTTVS